MLTDKVAVHDYTRRITPIERLFAKSPYSIVTMVMLIKGTVSEGVLRTAVSKAQHRHPNLRSRIVEDGDHIPWLTTDGAKAIPIEIVQREADDHWIKVIQASCLIPFDFDERPPVRFILVQSPAVSELLILCHHIICDGLSLAYLARDLMLHMGDPSREVDVLPDPEPVALSTMPSDVSTNGIVKFVINRINKKWQKEAIHFDQEDYRCLSEAYWTKYQHQVSTIELSEKQTAALVVRCKNEDVTVNSALTAAFVSAQTVLQDQFVFHPGIVIAGSLRDRLRPPAGEGMGFFAGAITLKHQYDTKVEFWENARRLHRQAKPRFTNKNLFKDPLTWSYLDPEILEAMNFKKIGGLVPSHCSRHQKLTSFSQRNDVVTSILKREKMDTLDKVFMGTAVTNLGRMDFPWSYGPLELERLIMKPGGGFPLASVNLVVGAVTCAGKLSLLIEYAEQAVDTPTMMRIKDQAMEFLLSV